MDHSHVLPFTVPGQVVLAALCVDTDPPILRQHLAHLLASRDVPHELRVDRSRVSWRWRSVEHHSPVSGRVSATFLAENWKAGMKSNNGFSILQAMGCDTHVNHW